MCSTFWFFNSTQLKTTQLTPPTQLRSTHLNRTQLNSSKLSDSLTHTLTLSELGHLLAQSPFNVFMSVNRSHSLRHSITQYLISQYPTFSLLHTLAPLLIHALAQDIPHSCPPRALVQSRFELPVATLPIETSLSFAPPDYPRLRSHSLS